MSPEIAARLERLQIAYIVRTRGAILFLRENCAAFGQVQDSIISYGSSSIMTEGGLAFLVWRDGQAFLATHGGGEVAATPEQVESIQRFSGDLKAALGS